MPNIILQNNVARVISLPQTKLLVGGQCSIELNDVQFDETLLEMIAGYVTEGVIKCYLDSERLTADEVLTLKYREVDSLKSSGRTETDADLELYVNNVTGDDYSGDGTTVNPYKTLSFLENLPFTIKNVIHVRFQVAGTYTGFPKFFKRRYIETGKIILDASALTYPLQAGPFTVDTVTDIGVPDVHGNTFATDLKVTGTPGWSADQYYGKFIHVLTGNWAGNVLPCWKNSSDTLRTFADQLTFAPGDTFNIVDCPVTVEFERTLIEGDSLFNEELYRVSDISPWGIQFLTAAIKFKGTSGDRSFTFKNISATMPFCVVMDSDQWLFLELYNSQLNWQSIYVPTLDDSNLDNYESLCTNVLPSNGAVPSNDRDNIMLHNSEIAFCTVRGRIQGWRSYSSNIYGCICGGITFEYSNGMNEITVTCIEQIGFASIAILAAGRTKIYSCHVEACSRALQTRGHTIISYLMGNTTAANEAVLVQEASVVYCKGTPSRVDIVGAVTAIRFSFDGATSAWPVSGVTVTSNGGDVVAMK